jgi:hypothetical protein
MMKNIEPIFQIDIFTEDGNHYTLNYVAKTKMKEIACNALKNSKFYFKNGYGKLDSIKVVSFRVIRTINA